MAQLAWPGGRDINIWHHPVKSDLQSLMAQLVCGQVEVASTCEVRPSVSHGTISLARWEQHQSVTSDLQSLMAQLAWPGGSGINLLLQTFSLS